MITYNYKQPIIYYTKHTSIKLISLLNVLPHIGIKYIIRIIVDYCDGGIHKYYSTIQSIIKEESPYNTCWFSYCDHWCNKIKMSNDNTLISKLNSLNNDLIPTIPEDEKLINAHSIVNKPIICKNCAYLSNDNYFVTSQYIKKDNKFFGIFLCIVCINSLSLKYNQRPTNNTICYNYNIISIPNRKIIEKCAVIPCYEIIKKFCNGVGLSIYTMHSYQHIPASLTMIEKLTQLSKIKLSPMQLPITCMKLIHQKVLKILLENNDHIFNNKCFICKTFFKNTDNPYYIIISNVVSGPLSSLIKQINDNKMIFFCSSNAACLSMIGYTIN